MSKRKRRHLTAEFKARVALEALKEEKSIQQIAKDEDVAPTQISAHLPTDGEGSCLPCGNHGLEEPSGPVLGAE